MLVTQVATAAAALAWMGLEWAAHGKPSALGVATGAIAGLVAITPASGTAGPAGAMLIGLVAGCACFVAATRLKRIFGYDDSLDVFGVHAVGGIVGAVLTGVTAGTLGGSGLPEGVSIAGQVWVQAKSVLFTAAWSGIGTWLILKLIDATVGVRVSREQEVEGLDLALHDERAYNPDPRFGYTRSGPIPSVTEFKGFPGPRRHTVLRTGGVTYVADFQGTRSALDGGHRRGRRGRDRL